MGTRGPLKVSASAEEAKKNLKMTYGTFPARRREQTSFGEKRSLVQAPPLLFGLFATSIFFLALNSPSSIPVAAPFLAAQSANIRGDAGESLNGHGGGGGGNAGQWSRDGGGGGASPAVLNSPVSVNPSSVDSAFRVVQSSRDKNERFSTVTVYSTAPTETITIHPNLTMQTIIGFGGAFTESCELLNLHTSIYVFLLCFMFIPPFPHVCTFLP